MGGAKKPESVPVPEGRARLEAADCKPMEGGHHARFEIWFDAKGCPQTISYVGPPYGQHFLKSDLDDIVPLN